ncbi:MAG: SDR family NAD(P)-dependent oxidoreductase, partial [Phaeodactylibacter sp.]|nr:SDR family NAD(P)-dependent oxidoreductase [Phaeodactylibacter sp.]
MLNAFSLTNKNAVVTGASRGLGQAIAIALAEAGAYVLCCSSRPGGTDATLREIEARGGKAIGLHADLSDREAVKRMYDAA